MNLVETIRAIQRRVGAKPDGVFGPLTAGRVLAELTDTPLVIPRETVTRLDDGTIANLDARTVANIGTLDPKARDAFVRFALLANATAATYGCTYLLISGNRTWEEQDQLYAKGRTAPGGIVTNAKGGQSNHNLGIAGDFGVFQGKVYLDGGSVRKQRDLASKVHKACSLHAAECGLEWGGSWTSMKDEPHYEVATGLTLAAKRALYLKFGSVL